MDGTLPAPQADQLTGRIVSISGSQIIALLQNHPAGRSPLQIGSLAKMRTPNSSVFGVVSGVNVPMPMPDAADKELQTVELELLGEIVGDEGGAPGRFQRGVSVFP